MPENGYDSNGSVLTILSVRHVQKACQFQLTQRKTTFRILPVGNNTTLASSQE